jgi:hypothetical protein
MIDTNLILIDGLTGSGKSTTAQRLWLHLVRHGHDAQWFYEHDTAHPIWRWSERFQMAEAGVLDPSFLDDTVVARWRKLAAERAGTRAVAILESTFFQTTVGFLLVMNVAARTIVEHVLAVDHIIAGLKPVLIYFRQRDVAQSLRATCDDRRADHFETDLIKLIGGTPYGKANGLSDFAGLVGFYDHWCEIVELLFTRVGMSKLAIDRSDGDWRSRERQLTDFLSLPEIQEVAARIDQPSRFLGRYRDANSSDEIVVAGNEQGLYFDDARRTRLIPKQGSTFHVEALCIELSFADEGGGRFQRLELRGNLPSLSPVWVRT